MRNACIFMECPITKMILAVSRKDDPNAWGLPGGKVEDGETELQGAIRELREETGIVLYDAVPWYDEIFRREGCVTFSSTIYNIYRVDLIKEKGRVAWVTAEQLMVGPFGDYNRRMLKAIGRIPINECYLFMNLM